ncbi:hypothetical protein Tco_0040971 [Tanacetum coccineum]
MAGPVEGNAVARRVIDYLVDFSGETSVDGYMRRLIRVLHDEVDIAKNALGQVNAMIGKMEAMDKPFEYADNLGCLKDSKRILGWKIMGLNQRIEDTEGEIRTFKGHLDIMDAAINLE